MLPEVPPVTKNKVSANVSATRAATGLVVNRQIAGLQAGPVRISALRFLATLPASDDVWLMAS